MNNQYIFIKNQRGVVLFIALVALVVMSLAAVALIRSVDTNAMITGNLSFKQSAVVSSDRGVEAALVWVNATAIANLDSLNTNITGNGYYASFNDSSASPDLDNIDVLKLDATWDNNKSKAVTGAGFTGVVEEDTGNSINYIIQRMCSAAVTEPTKEACLYASSSEDNSSHGGRSGQECCEIIAEGESPVYRVTVRVKGPKSTVSYTQTYVY